MSLKIVNKDYNHTCGDGCCDTYGTITKITYNGVEYTYDSYDSGTNYQTFLEEVLGAEIEYEYIFDEDDFDE